MSRWLLQGVLLLFALVWLTGCATPMPVPEFKPTAGMKVGIWVDIDGTPTHQHIGTTIFNNFTREYPEQRWPLTAPMHSALTSALETAGFDVVDLKAADISGSELARPVRAMLGKWRVNPDTAPLFQRLREEQGLSAVVYVFNPGSHAVALEMNMAYDMIPRFATGPGLYSRGFIGKGTDYRVVPGIKFEVTWLDPMMDLSNNGMLVYYREPTAFSTGIPGFKPVRRRHLTDADWQPVRTQIDEQIQKYASRIAQRLRNRPYWEPDAPLPAADAP